MSIEHQTRIERQCYCGEPAGAHCAHCDHPYCSRSCQAAHWPVHKKLCKNSAGPKSPAGPKCPAGPKSLAAPKSPAGPKSLAAPKSPAEPSRAAPTPVCLPESSGVTALLYSAAAVQESGGRRAAVAAAPIRRGEIALVEFVCTAGETVLQVAVSLHETLFTHLWPRAPAEGAAPAGGAAPESAAHAQRAVRAQLAYDKSRLNVFGIQPFFDSELNPQYLGLHLSMLNHAADFNCAIDTVRPRGSELCFAVAVAQRDIPAGAELTIDYGPGYPEPFVAGNCFEREADYDLFRPLSGPVLAHLREGAELIYAVLPQQARLLTLRGIAPSLADGSTIEIEVTADVPAAERLLESFKRDVRSLLAGKIPLVSDTLASLTGHVEPLSLGKPRCV